MLGLEVLWISYSGLIWKYLVFGQPYHKKNYPCQWRIQRDFHTGILVWVCNFFCTEKSKYNFLYTDIFYYRLYFFFFFQVQTHTLSTEDYSNAWKTFTLKGFHVTDGHQHFYVELLDMLHSLWKHFAQKTSGYVTACCHNHHMFFWLISFVLGIFSLGFVEWV